MGEERLFPESKVVVESIQNGANLSDVISSAIQDSVAGNAML
jgi:hypothetical protein